MNPASLRISPGASGEVTQVTYGFSSTMLT